MCLWWWHFHPVDDVVIVLLLLVFFSPWPFIAPSAHTWWRRNEVIKPCSHLYQETLKDHVLNDLLLSSLTYHFSTRPSSRKERDGWCVNERARLIAGMIANTSRIKYQDEKCVDSWWNSCTIPLIFDRQRIFPIVLSKRNWVWQALKTGCSF